MGVEATLSNQSHLATHTVPHWIAQQFPFNPSDAVASHTLGEAMGATAVEKVEAWGGESLGNWVSEKGMGHATRAA